jgi:hypothetical protein
MVALQLNAALQVGNASTAFLAHEKAAMHHAHDDDGGSERYHVPERGVVDLKASLTQCCPTQSFQGLFAAYSNPSGLQLGSELSFSPRINLVKPSCQCFTAASPQKLQSVGASIAD